MGPLSGLAARMGTRWGCCASARSVDASHLRPATGHRPTRLGDEASEGEGSDRWCDVARPRRDGTALHADGDDAGEPVRDDGLVGLTGVAQLLFSSIEWVGDDCGELLG